MAQSAVPAAASLPCPPPHLTAPHPTHHLTAPHPTHHPTHHPSALHKACANGHTECARRLLDAGAAFLTNASGNTPLHWAAQNSKLDTAKLLLERFDEATIDVLAKNSFGHGALTDAFKSNNPELVSLLLEHPSSSEEKLLSTPHNGKEMPGEEEDAGDGFDVEIAEPAVGAKKAGKGKAGKGKAGKKKKGKKGGEAVDTAAADEEDVPSVTHEFRFGGSGRGWSPTVQIRELPIEDADNPFVNSAHEDTTGLGIWCASLVLARWAADLAPQLRGKAVLELGSGCGASGVAAVAHGQPRKAYLTDLNADTVANLAYNVDLNRDVYAAGSLAGSMAALPAAPPAAGSAGSEATPPAPPAAAATSEEELVGRVEALEASDAMADQRLAALEAKVAALMATAVAGAKGKGPQVEAMVLDWARQETWPNEPLDVVLCSDCVYDAGIVPLLSSVVKGLLRSGGMFFYVAPDTGRAGLPEFLSGLAAKHGFEHVEDVEAPASYKANPLASGDDNEALLHFTDLGTSTYRLHTFMKL